jgi:hypothetical protein
LKIDRKFPSKPTLTSRIISGNLHPYLKKNLKTDIDSHGKIVMWEQFLKNYDQETHFKHGRVAELVDALDLGSSGESRGGSNPFSPIKTKNFCPGRIRRISRLSKE